MMEVRLFFKKIKKNQKKLKKMDTAKKDTVSHIPSNYLCPISGKFLKTPVMTSTGLIYSYQSIADKIKQSPTAVMDHLGQPILDLTLVPLPKLEEEIAQWSVQYLKINEQECTNQIPNAYLCGISHSLLVEPVATSCNQIYSSNAIKQDLTKQRKLLKNQRLEKKFCVDPATKKELAEPVELVPQEILNLAMAQWCAKNPKIVIEHYEDLLKFLFSKKKEYKPDPFKKELAKVLSFLDENNVLIKILDAADIKILKASLALLIKNKKIDAHKFFMITQVLKIDKLIDVTCHLLKKGFLDNEILNNDEFIRIIKENNDFVFRLLEENLWQDQDLLNYIKCLSRKQMDGLFSSFIKQSKFEWVKLLLSSNEVNRLIPILNYGISSKNIFKLFDNTQLCRLLICLIETNHFSLVYSLLSHLQIKKIPTEIMEEIIVKLIESNNIEFAKYLLRNKKSVFFPAVIGEERKTIFHLVAKCGDSDLLELVYRKNRNPNIFIEDDLKKTLLNIAINAKSCSLIELMLNKETKMTEDELKEFILDRKFVTDEEALELVHSENGLIKTIEDKDCDWTFWIDQLNDPKHKRPVRLLLSTTDRSNCIDPRTGEQYVRKLDETPAKAYVYDKDKQVWTLIQSENGRGRFKKTTFIKKSAATLLSSDGQILLYFSGVALGFNIKHCDMREQKIPGLGLIAKFAFLENSFTNGKWWVQRGYNSIATSIGVEKIREANRQAKSIGVILKHNELLPRISKRAVSFIGIVLNNDRSEDLIIKRKLQAISRQYYVAEKMELQLPILIFSINNPVRVYAIDDQIADVLSVIKSKKYSYFSSPSIENIAVAKKIADLWKSGKFLKELYGHELLKLENDKLPRLTQLLNDNGFDLFAQFIVDLRDNRKAHKSDLLNRRLKFSPVRILFKKTKNTFTSETINELINLIKSGQFDSAFRFFEKIRVKYLSINEINNILSALIEVDRLDLTTSLFEKLNLAMISPKNLNEIIINFAKNNHVELIKKLLENKNCQTISDDSLGKVLFYLVENEQFNLAEKILLSKARITLTDEDTAALLFNLTRANHFNLTAQLLSKLDNESVGKFYFRATPDQLGKIILNLMRARRFDLARYLLEHADEMTVVPDAQSGDCALHYAVRFKQKKTVIQLCQKACRLDQRNRQGESPFWLAVRDKNYEIVKLLLENGIDSLSNEPTARMTAIVTQLISDRRFDLIELLLKKNINIDHQTIKTALDNLEFSIVDFGADTCVNQFFENLSQPNSFSKINNTLRKEIEQSKADGIIKSLIANNVVTVENLDNFLLTIQADKNYGRKLGAILIFELIKNAQSEIDVLHIVETLNQMDKETIGFIRDRQGLERVCVERYTWEDRDVSEIWTKLMRHAKNCALEFHLNKDAVHAERGFFDNNLVRNFLSQRTKKWSIFATDSLEIYNSSEAKPEQAQLMLYERCVEMERWFASYLKV